MIYKEMGGKKSMRNNFKNFCYVDLHMSSIIFNDIICNLKHFKNMLLDLYEEACFEYNFELSNEYMRQIKILNYIIYFLETNKEI